ncbi:hypothetical protein CPB84DRAFT_1849821 [Gymnopilus junonius]|uniref:Uncharacterized protein n=1 Tax=Gymnopilus junonius TaxID=109634 RepID=A0A9P5NH68_GYMJU|nr:hypothetical protein CPB84DRAFT_1849821 [Gymnopilus junonius]
MALSVNVPFPPIYNGNPAYSVVDPLGFLPLNCCVHFESRNWILEWSVDENRLALWYWPIENNHCVPPSDLNDYRQMHNCYAPTCLCAVYTETCTESAIFLVTTGPLTGTDLATHLTQAFPLPRWKPKTTFGALMALNSTRHGGLTEEEFNNLFLKSFHAHTCEPTTLLPSNAEIIDLTLDDD